MSGPMGGQPGAIPRGGKGRGKGGFPSKRKMPLKGLRKGLYILVSYREKKAPGMLDEKVDYEGIIVDKRVGWDNRESYVELGDCLRLNAEGEIVAKEGTKRLFDAFIDDCEEVEKVERPLSAQLITATALGSTPPLGATGHAAACQAGSTGASWDGAANMATMGMPMGAQAMMQVMGGATSPSADSADTVAASSGTGMAGCMMPAMGMSMGMGMGGMPIMGMPMGMVPMMGMGMGGMPMGMMPAPMMGMMPMQMMGMMPMGAAATPVTAAPMAAAPIAAAPMAAAPLAAAPMASVATPMAAMPMATPMGSMAVPMMGMGGAMPTGAVASPGMPGASASVPSAGVTTVAELPVQSQTEAGLPATTGVPVTGAPLVPQLNASEAAVTMLAPTTEPARRSRSRSREG